jgi:hypothetical protein
MRRPLSDLPSWPRFLSREQAAVYLGVSTDTFDAEVRDGFWPAPRRRGYKGGRLTWDRCALDAIADRDSGLSAVDSPLPLPATGVWGERSNGPATRDRLKGRSKGPT